MLFFILLITIIFLSYLLNRIWMRIFNSSFRMSLKKSLIFDCNAYHYFLIPGVFIHEMSHAIACLIVGAKIKDISFISKDGGYVLHTEPKIPIIGNILISFAPIFGAILSVYLISLFFNFPIIAMDKLNIIEFFNIIKNNILDWQFWIIFYFITSILICLIPSWQDIKNSFTSLFFILIIALLLEWFGISCFYIFNNSKIINLLFFGITIQIFIILFSFPIYLLKIKDFF